MPDAERTGDRSPDWQPGGTVGGFATLRRRMASLAVDFQFRRGAFFLVNIGLPILIGLWRGEEGGGLIGAVTGLLLSLADTEGSLGARVRMGLIVASGIAFGAVVGLWLRDAGALFWGASRCC